MASSFFPESLQDHILFKKKKKTIFFGSEYEEKKTGMMLLQTERLMFATLTSL